MNVSQVEVTRKIYNTSKVYNKFTSGRELVSSISVTSFSEQLYISVLDGSSKELRRGSLWPDVSPGNRTCEKEDVS